MHANKNFLMNIGLFDEHRADAQFSFCRSDINPDVFTTENRVPREESNKGSTINMDSLKTLLG